MSVGTGRVLSLHSHILIISESKYGIIDFHISGGIGYILCVSFAKGVMFLSVEGGEEQSQLVIVAVST